MKTKIILGPPGTGKTHTLLNRVEEELARGTPPDRIAFLAFTKKAATEARDRAMKKFDLEEQHLPYFRTLHSFAFHQLGLTKAEVMSRDNYKEFAQAFGMDLSFGTQLGIIATATLASIGSAAVPGAGIIMLVIILEAIGVPSTGIALILGVDRILDMLRTVVNVTGDATIAVTIAASEGQLRPPKKIAD